MSNTARVKITLTYDALHAALERSSGIKCEPFQNRKDAAAAIPIILSSETIDASHAQFTGQTCDTAIVISMSNEILRGGTKLLEVELYPAGIGGIGACTYAVRRLQTLLA